MPIISPSGLPKITVLDQDYHRNGIGGDGFHVYLLTTEDDLDENDEPIEFVVTIGTKYVEVVPGVADSGVHVLDPASCRVLALTGEYGLNAGTVGSAWRGDNFGHALVLLEDAEAENRADAAELARDPH